MKGKVAPTKSTTKAYVSFCFSLSAVVLPALCRFLYRQWNKRNYSTPFPKCFLLFLAIKTLWVKLFSLNVCEAALQAAIKGGNFARNHTPLWLLIGRIIFLTLEKTSFAILIGRIIFVTCENLRSLLWLARTNLRTKIYDIAVWWVFLSMYLIKLTFHLVDSFHLIIVSVHLLRHHGTRVLPVRASWTRIRRYKIFFPLFPSFFVSFT